MTVQSSFAPNGTMLNMHMEDLQYLGDSELTVTYDTYLGLFTRIRTINGNDFDPSVIRYASIRSNASGAAVTGISPVLTRASYKAYEEYPNADYFIVTRQESKITMLIMGKEIESKATVKAYKIK
ncbi:MAG: hypothetical protein J5737_06340 [Bacteroidales bacterium]|nr:hypothetical protein [Bacteroidales bacterium]